MQSVTLEVPLHHYRVRVALVQLSSPFAGESPDLLLVSDNEATPDPQFVWVSRAIESRTETINTILGFLPTFEPHVVVFPEYSVPFQCHAQLQKFANSHSCIVVPGSYYQRDPTRPRFRENVCSIFIPGQEPLEIVKYGRVGPEEKALTITPGEPNVAHLTWRAEGHDMSISVFICHDYLVPYGPQRTSLADWERPGLNLVVMHSAHVELFDGVAGLDVRRLRGKGRFVALCNCANATQKLGTPTGTALLGPTKDIRRVSGDVIERLAATEEGILTAELDLRNVSFVQTRPAITEHDPLLSVRQYQITRSNLGQVLVDQGLSTSQVTERGVWHPAVLEVLDRGIALVLRKSFRYREVASMLRDPVNRRIHSVSATALVGEQDFLFRAYEHTSGKPRLFDPPYSSLSPEEARSLFQGEPLKYLVEPHGIFKYRTVVVSHDQTAWEVRKNKIAALLSCKPKSRHRLLSAVGRLARDWNTKEVSEWLREQVKSFFMEAREEVVRLGPNSGNNLRRRYVMVHVTPWGDVQSDIFERHIIRNWLQNLAEVRSIYRLTPKREAPFFQYWIDAVADPYTIDKIVMELQNRCEAERLTIGTRSMEVMEHLLDESVEGIEKTDFGEDACRLLQTLTGVELDDALMQTHFELFLEWARAWDDQVAAIDVSLAAGARTHVTKYYGALVKLNFAKHDGKEELVREAASHWTMLYQDLESACRELLAIWCKQSDDRALVEHVEQVLGPPKKDLVRMIRGDWVRLLLEYLPFDNQKRGLPDFERERNLRSDLDTTVRPFRNAMIHEGTQRKLRALYAVSDAAENDESARRRTEATKIVVEFMNSVLTALAQENSPRHFTTGHY